MRRSIRNNSLAIITFVVLLASCGGDGHDTSSPTTTIKAKSAAVSSTTSTTLPTTTIPPQLSDGHVEGELVTQEVVAWGTKIASKSDPLTLKAIGYQPGDLDSTTQLNFELCASKDTTITDGGYDEFLQVVKLPEDGVINANYDSPDYNPEESDLLWPSAVITIDNTPTKVVESGEGYPSEYDDPGHLMQILPADHCTPVKVEVRSAELGSLVIGFAHTTIPFGEWRPNGGFTRLQQQAKATSFQHQWDVN